MKKKLESSCRVAFVALIHDIGKFYQRTQLTSARDEEKQLYCPQTDYGWSHIHAAYTAVAIDKLESRFPKMVGEDVFPFKSVHDRNIDDSLINAAAQHHKPKTFLQTVITVADRLSSAFEREEYADYTKARDSDNYISARLSCAFEELDKENIHQSDLTYTYPLKSLSVDALFPEQKKTLSQQEATQEYAHLWQAFEKDLALIPESCQRV